MTLRLGCAISKQLEGFPREDYIATSPGEEGRGDTAARFITSARCDHITVDMRARSGDERGRRATCLRANHHFDRVSGGVDGRSPNERHSRADPASMTPGEAPAVIGPGVYPASAAGRYFGLTAPGVCRTICRFAVHRRAKRGLPMPCGRRKEAWVAARTLVSTLMVRTSCCRAPSRARPVVAAPPVRRDPAGRL
jgi:hypothetical protein